MNTRYALKKGKFARAIREVVPSQISVRAFGTAPLVYVCLLVLTCFLLLRKRTYSTLPHSFGLKASSAYPSCPRPSLPLPSGSMECCWKPQRGRNEPGCSVFYVVILCHHVAHCTIEVGFEGDAVSFEVGSVLVAAPAFQAAPVSHTKHTSPCVTLPKGYNGAG